MKEKTKILLGIFGIAVIIMVLSFFLLVSSSEGEILLEVDCIGKDIFTVIGNTTDERTIYVYYNLNKGSADCKFNFYILQNPQFIISLNDKQLYPVIAGTEWIEYIRLTRLHEIKKATLVVSPWGEKDCFFETDTFTLAWSCVRGYRDHKDFLIRYYNVDKVGSLNWTVPMGFNLSIDDVWLMGHFVEATTSYNGWYTLRGHLSSYNEPWKDVDVDLWFKPDTFETHIEGKT